MSDIDNRMSVSLSELANLNDWLGRLGFAATSVELRMHDEPGIGVAITAYVETANDEGYFRLLTVTPK